MVRNRKDLYARHRARAQPAHLAGLPVLRFTPRFAGPQTSFARQGEEDRGITVRRSSESPVHRFAHRFAGPQASFARQGKEDRAIMGQRSSESPVLRFPHRFAGSPVLRFARPLAPCALRHAPFFHAPNFSDLPARSSKTGSRSRPFKRPRPPSAHAISSKVFALSGRTPLP